MDLQRSPQDSIYDSIIKNRRIKVFLSSTFKDMSKERDFLAKNVFVQLEAAAARRNVALNLLDLRWGITEEESKQGLVTEICLKEIEASRPFFIGIVGDRYGWIPEEKDYPADSSLFQSFPWVKEDIKEGRSITEIEIQYGVLRNHLPCRAFFYLKEEASEDAENTPEETAKLKELKTKILGQKEHPVKYFKDSRELGELIKKDIWEQLDALFPQFEETDPIKESANIQECIVRTKTDHYVPIAKAFDQIDNFILSPQPLFVILGESGTGKSALLANWLKANLSKHCIFYHFIDSAGNCADHDFILRRFYFYLCELFQVDPDMDSREWDEEVLGKAIGFLLETGDKDVIFILDGLNQLNNFRDAYQLGWFPSLTRHLKIICSTNEENRDILMALRHKSGILYEIPLFADFPSFQNVINGYLLPFGKKLNEKQIEQIIGNDIFKNSLILFSLLEELRLYGDYDTLNETIAHYAASASELDFMSLVFQRLTNDLSFFGNSNAYVGKVLFLLAVSRDGLSEDAISRILDIPQIIVSSLLLKCHRFISVLGTLNSIAHSKIEAAVIQLYEKEVGNEVFAAFESYLTGCVQQMDSGRSYLTAVLQLSHLYYQQDRLEELNKLITTPQVFLTLHDNSLNELRQYYLKTAGQGYSLLPLVSNLEAAGQFGSRVDESELLLLAYARKLCLSVNQFEDLSKLLSISETWYNDGLGSEVHRALYLGDYLNYCSYTGCYDKGYEIAGRLLEEPGTPKPLRALACINVAEYLRNTDIEGCVEHYSMALKLYLEFEDYEGAIVSLINAGISLAKAGIYDKALEMYQKAEYYISVHIKNYPLLIIQRFTCYSNMASLYGRMNDHAKMEENRQNAHGCFLQIRNSEFEPLLSPVVIVSEQADFGYRLMAAGNIQEGLDELTQAREKLEFYEPNMSQTQYAIHRFDIYSTMAKGYACNQRFSEAVDVLLPIRADLEDAFDKQPEVFAEQSLLYLRLMANLLSDMGEYEKAVSYLQKALEQYEVAVKVTKLGYNSYHADTLRLYAECLIAKGDLEEGLACLSRARDEYDLLTVKDDSCLEPFIETAIESFSVRYHGKTIEHYTLDLLEGLQAELRERMSAQPQFALYYIVVCVKIIMLHREAGTLVEAEDCFLHLYRLLDLFKKEESPFHFVQTVLPFMAYSADELAKEKHDRRFLKDTLLYSQMAVVYLDAVTVTSSNAAQVSSVIQHCANYHDEAGLRREALGLYQKALHSLELQDDDQPILRFRKAGILYDLSQAMIHEDREQAKGVLEECVALYQDLYDADSNVAIQYADAEQALANILDDEGDFPEAERLYRSAIHVLEYFTEEPLALGRLGLALNNYGIMLTKQHRFSEAREKLLHSREIRKETDTFRTIYTDDTLYRLEYVQGNVETACSYLKEILDILEQYGVIESDSLNEFADYTDTYASFCLEIGKDEDAKRAYSHLYDLVGAASAGGRVMRKNRRHIRKRVQELFKTTAFLSD